MHRSVSTNFLLVSLWNKCQFELEMSQGSMAKLFYLSSFNQTLQAKQKLYRNCRAQNAAD